MKKTLVILAIFVSFSSQSCRHEVLRPGMFRRYQLCLLQRCVEVVNGIVIGQKEQSICLNCTLLIWIPRNVEALKHASTSLQFIGFDEGSILLRIQQGAFMHNTKLRSLCLPASVEVIDEYSFFCCISLMLVSFSPNSKLLRIGKNAFSCSGLTFMRLPSSVEVIGEVCFCNCKNLTSVTFDQCSKLSRIEKSAFEGSGLTSIHLPASVEIICESCFSECKSLVSVAFDQCSKLSRIERYAFKGSGLTSIRLPASVLIICESCFGDCKDLLSVIFDQCSKLSRIERYAFKGSGLTSICLPASVEVICGNCLGSGRYARCKCKILDRIVPTRSIALF